MHLSLFVLLVIWMRFVWVTALDPSDMENEIVGPLNVTCQGGSALISFKTKTAFGGRVYVKGAYAKPQCNRDFSGGQNESALTMMPLTDCGTQKDSESTFERAFKYVSIVVISFHSKFITKGDKAYRVECLYRSGDTEVSNELNISDLATESYAYQPAPPVCQYSLHVGNLSGPLAKSIRVGDALFHRWNCDSGHYSIFVHNCYATGPGQEQVELLDDNGCSVDPQIMSNLTYSKSRNESWVETRAFRYQDGESMRFNCKISTCLKADTGCVENLPTRCSTTSRARRSKRRSIDRSRIADQLLYSPPVKLTEPFETEVEEVTEVGPVHPETQPIESILIEQSISSGQTSAVCLARSAMAVLAAAVISLLCFLLISLSVIFSRRK